MAQSKDIQLLHQPVKDFLRKQGVSLNPLSWHATWQLPEDYEDVNLVSGKRTLFVLKTSPSQFRFIKSAEKNLSGEVYELRRREGSSGPTPAAPRIELRRVHVQPVEEYTNTQPTHSVDDTRPKHFAELSYRYGDGSPVSLPYRIETKTNGTLTGNLVAGDTGCLPLHGASKISYQIGEPVQQEHWQKTVQAIELQADALFKALAAQPTIAEVPKRIQNLFSIQLGLLTPANPCTMPTRLYTEGYPVLELAKTATDLFEAEHHKPHIFTERFRARHPEAYHEHLALSFGLNEINANRETAAKAYFDTLLLASQQSFITILEPHLHHRFEDAADAEGALLELTLLCLITAGSTSSTTKSGNQNPLFTLSRDLGKTLKSLAQLAEQQCLFLSVTEQDSYPINATAQLPPPLIAWQPVPESNWMELNYDDAASPFPLGTQLSYWLYDEADELLYEGDDLTPNVPKRFLLPNTVAEVSYHFAANLDPTLFEQVIARFGQPIVQLFDVSPLMDREPGLSFTYPSSTGQNVVLRPREVAQLQQAIAALNLPVDERGLVLPNSYVILAAPYTNTDDIKQTVYHQFGNALSEEDWQLVEDQLAHTSNSHPILLDLTWLYADIVFRAAAERYDDPQVQLHVKKLTELVEQEPDIPKDPWYRLFAYASPNFQPSEEEEHRLKLGLTQSELKERLDFLYEQQKDAGLIPYRQTFNEFLEWTNALLFGLATFFVPVEKWAIGGGQAILAILRHKYFVGAAAAGALLYSGDAEAGKYKMPSISVAKGAIRLTASKVLREQAENYGILYKAVNSPSNIGLDGGIGRVKQLHIGKTPQQALPSPPKGHHWFKQADGSYNTKRNPSYDGPRKAYNADEGYFYVTSNTTTKGTNRAKAELGELKAHEYMIADGHTPVPGFKHPLYGHHGVDGLYFNGRPPPKYIVMEAKYHKSSYGWTKSDGKQMSDKWIEKKIINQLRGDALDDFELEGYAKIGLRYIPDLGRSIKEEITW